jgi:hypothetical protein
MIQDIVITRMADGTVTVNVPMSVAHHSSGVYEIGYGGSGPADLALNILAFLFPGLDVKCATGHCSQKAWALHQSFKWNFLAGMPREGGTIKGEAIVSWLACHDDQGKREGGAGAD